MTIGIRTLLALWLLLAVSVALAASHEIHDLQRDVAVLRVEQQQAAGKLALQQKMDLTVALHDLGGKVDQLTVRLDDTDKRISDISLYISLVALVMTALGVIGGIATYNHAHTQAREMANEWMSTHGRGEINDLVKPLLKEQKEALEKANAEIKMLRDRANAELDELKKQGAQPPRHVGVDTMAPAASGSAASAPPFGAPATFTTYADARAAALASFGDGRYDDALAVAQQALALAHTPLQKLQARRARGAILFPRDFAAALEDFSATAIEFPSDLVIDGELALEVAKAHLGKAKTLGALHRERDAIPALAALVARLSAVDDGPLGEVLAETLNDLAYMYLQAQRPREAVETAQQLLQRFGSNPAIEFKRFCAAAELRKALALGQLGDQQAERDAYRKLCDRYQSEADGEIRTLVSYARYNAGVVHEKLGELDAARQIYREIDQMYSGESLPELVSNVNDARHRLRVLEATKSPNDPAR